MEFKKRLRSVSLIFACGTALFSDGYSNGVIGSVNTLLTRIYGKEAFNAHNHKTVLNSLTFAGTVLGMLIFGYLSDKVGRKFGMMASTAIIALFSGLSAASSGAHGSVGGLLAMLSVMRRVAIKSRISKLPLKYDIRFFLGIGIGAEYPCGSVSASEQCEEPGINKMAQHRWFALATNTMIDFGFVISAFVPLVLFWIFGNDHLRAVWRLSLGLGLVPAAAVFLWRLNMDEPTRYKQDSMKRIKIPYKLVLKRYWVSLAAVSTTWFIYDLIVYPFGLYSSTIFDNITGGSEDLGIILGWNVVANLFYMPGTFFGAFILDYLGPKYTMIAGLILQAIIGFFMSGFYTQLSKHLAGFAIVYGIFLSFGELGPGNCLGLLASKTSATAIRGHFYGIAAAVGKVGAFVGIWVFPPIINAFGGPDTVKGNTGPFWIGSGLAILSALITLFFIKPLTADGMAIEDQEFRQYLEAHGFDTSMMGLGIESEGTFVEEVTEEKVSTEKV